jgi:hypothetical protein
MGFDTTISGQFSHLTMTPIDYSLVCQGPGE